MKMQYSKISTKSTDKHFLPVDKISEFNFEIIIYYDKAVLILNQKNPIS